MTPRDYNLYLTRMQKLGVAIPLIVFTVLPVVALVMLNSASFAEVPASARPPTIFFALFFVFAAFYALSLLSLPYRISVTRDKQLVFKSFLRTRAVRISELVSIEPRNLNIQIGVSGYMLKHQNGKILFPGQFTGQYILLYELKQAKPALEMKGC